MMSRSRWALRRSEQPLRSGSPGGLVRSPHPLTPSRPPWFWQPWTEKEQGCTASAAFDVLRQGGGQEQDEPGISVVEELSVDVAFGMVRSVCDITYLLPEHVE